MNKEKAFDEIRKITDSQTVFETTPILTAYEKIARITLKVSEDELKDALLGVNE